MEVGKLKLMTMHEGIRKKNRQQATICATAELIVNWNIVSKFTKILMKVPHITYM